jgi:hypothetical protein
MTANTNNSLIRAIEYCPPEASPIDSAQRIAQQISSPMQAGLAVVVSMEGLLGASSSFFNVIYSTLRDVLGAEAVDERLTFVGLGPTMKLVESRSRLAVLGIAP